MYISCNVIEVEKPTLEINKLVSMWYSFGYESACMMCLDCDSYLYFPMNYDNYLKFHEAVLYALKRGNPVFEIKSGIALSFDESNCDDIDKEFEELKGFAKKADYFKCFDYEY